MTVGPTFDQASKQNFVVNIQDSEFGKLVVRWRERDIWHENSFEIMFFNKQISEFWIPNIYNKILFILFFAWSKVGPTVIL